MLWCRAANSMLYTSVFTLRCSTPGRAYGCGGQPCLWPAAPLTASIATCYDYANGSSISAAPDPDAEFAHYMMYQRVFYAHDDWCFDDVGLAAEVGLRYQAAG